MDPYPAITKWASKVKKQEGSPGFLYSVYQEVREQTSGALKRESLAEPVSNQDRPCEPLEQKRVCGSMLEIM